VIGVFFYLAGRKTRAAHPFIKAVLITILMGTANSLIGTFQRLRDKGTIEGSLTWFLILAVLLLMLAVALLVRLTSKNAARTNE
jgi:hypothetical protein